MYFRLVFVRVNLYYKTTFLKRLGLLLSGECDNHYSTEMTSLESI